MCPSAKRDLGRSDLPKPSLLVDPTDIHISLEEICITIVIVVVVFFFLKKVGAINFLSHGVRT